MDWMEQAKACLAGGYDLHMHPSPSRAPRCVNDFEALRQADDAGMAGILLKNHDEPTASRAALCMLAVAPKATDCYGGVVLNYPEGGINACAVEAAAQMGAKIVWFPTCDAKHDLEFTGRKHPLDRPGLSVLNDEGKPLPAVYEVFDVAKQYGMAVGTGHLSLQEIDCLCAAGIRQHARMLFTHPEWRSVRAPMELQMKLEQMGVLIEKAWVPVSLGEVAPEEMVRTIRSLSPQNVYLVTDHGADYLKKPVDAMLEYVGTLLQNGFTRQEIRTLLHDNPERALGI